MTSNETVSPHATKSTVVVAAAPAQTPPVVDDEDVADPWESDELKDFSPMVAWESWNDTKQKSGDQSL